MADRYKIFEQLGNSGSHVVLKGYDTQTQSYVTIKQLLTSAEETALSDDQKTLLRSEADRLASLKHPHLASFIDLTSNEHGSCAVTELLELNDISKLLMRGVINLGDFLQIASQTLEAIHFAHQNGILHRALTPECIKINRKPDGQLEVKISDFGFEHISSIAGQQTEEIRKADDIATQYMAPEQLQGQPMDGRTDVYALGCIYYQSLSKKQPFRGANAEDTMNRHLQQMVTRLHDLCPQLPVALCDWVMWLLNVDPEYRPASAEVAIEFLKALDTTAPQQITSATKTITTSSAPVARVKSGAIPGMRPVTSSISGAVPGMRHITSTIPAHITSSISTAHPAIEPERSKLPIIIGGTVVALLFAGWFLFFGRSGGLANNLPPQPPPPWPGDIILHYRAGSGVVGIPPNNGDVSKEKPATLEERVRWHDLATLNGDSTLKSSKPENAPTFNKVVIPPGNMKHSAVVFKNADLLAVDAGDGADGFPFNTSSRKMGLTVVQVSRFENQGRDLRSFFISHHWNEEARLFLHGLKDGTYECFITSKTKQFKIKAPGSDCHQYSIVIATWDGNNGTAQMSVLSADGKRSISPLLKDIPKPSKPIVTLQMGWANTTAPTDINNTFAGEMLELIVYNSILPQRDRELLEKQLSGYYFGFQ